MNYQDYIDSAIDLISKGPYYNSMVETAQVYRTTNEELDRIIKKEYVDGKNVLSVLGSSDQLLTSYYLGAKEVDTFDKNPLAYYYFFLRKWSIMKTKLVFIPADNELLLECLEMHDDSEEEIDAYHFWVNVMKETYMSLYYSSFFFDNKFRFESPFQLTNEYIKFISSLKPNFHHLNIFEEVSLNKVYDTIILSNIIEYISDPEFNLVPTLTIVDNLLRLTRPGSSVIFSNVIDFDIQCEEELSKYFIYEKGESRLNYLEQKYQPISYRYIRK